MKSVDFSLSKNKVPNDPMQGTGMPVPQSVEKVQQGSM